MRIGLHEEGVQYETFIDHFASVVRVKARLVNKVNTTFIRMKLPLLQLHISKHEFEQYIYKHKCEFKCISKCCR